MNIVKGVADLLRRSSGGQGGEIPSWARADKSSVPSPKICFGDVGEEAILNTLWQKYENTVDKSEKRKLLQVFLMHFIQTYCNWEPADNVEQPASSTQTTPTRLSAFENAVIGCSFGHPSEVILILIQEISRITSLVTDYPVNLNASLPTPNIPEPSASLNFSTEALHALKSMALVTRSMHNCRVFCYYGGVQKVTALMKATVIQLRTLSGGIAVADCFSASDMETIDFLLKMLIYIISTIFSFMFPHPEISDRTRHIISAKPYFLNDYAFWIPPSNPREPNSEARVDWQKRAIVLVMEAGGVNWLVELLRVIRRLNLKEESPALPLQYLALSTLRSVLFQNTRAQNHFRSIGGLEVLLDELMLSPSNYLVAKSPPFESERCGRDLSGYFQLHILSLEVLRESIFGNLNNLQFLCENGRIQKFANSICSLAFMLQEFMPDRMLLYQSSSGMISNSAEFYQDCRREPSLSDDGSACDSNWTEYCNQLSRMLCSFLLPGEDINTDYLQASVTHVPAPVSFAYWEFSIKWVIKVLLAIFPCIKACSSEDELPAHLRLLANTLQHSVLHAFRKFLTSSPKLLEVFREEGIWDFIFSEKFFYFWATFEEYCENLNSRTGKHLETSGLPSNCSEFRVQHHNDVDILQIKAVSFLEFAATLGSNNLPECSILMETLEQSACKPKIAIILIKSLHRILQLSTEQTIFSFKKGDVVGRVLRVACIQAEERRKFINFNLHSQSDFDPADVANKWVQCMETSLDIFAEYLLVADNANRNMLHNTTCIDCLFDLLWEEEFRKQVLGYILGLMKLQTSSTEDRVAKLQLCSKYLEAFTLAKERDLTELLVDLLVGMREVLLLDKIYYQALFREVECFLHIVSLLNATPDEKTGEQLVLNVLQTLTLLLSGNDVSKSVFRTLVGVGYQMLQRVLLDFCRSHPSLRLLDALLDMLLDEKFDNKNVALIKNEDVIMLFLTILQKSSDFLQQYGLDIVQNLVKDSITNRAICFRAGILSFLLDWFSTEENDDIVIKLAELIQIVGGHSVSGKDIRKIFALLRSEKIGSNKKSCSLLLTSVQSMLKAKGPTAFFEFNGYDSGIVIKSPVQWPYNKGFSFSCWLRIESFPENGLMGLFSFYTDSGKGSSAMLGKEKLVFESVNQKRQSVTLSLNLLPKKWHFLCITHSIGRAFSGGSLLSCYVDGNLVSYEKCRYAKVTDALTCCNIGMRISHSNDHSAHFPINESFPFLGQIGPIYMFSDSLSSEQIKRIYLLGPSFMYSSVRNEVSQIADNSLSSGLLDVKDGSSSKIIFGLNAQASDGRTLFNVSSALEHMQDKNLFEAAVMAGTRLCSRRILQEIIYCVGGVSVFFPLLTRLESSETINEQCDHVLIKSIMSDKLVSEVIELITSVLDENLANQQQMHLLSGFSIMGLLFQSVPPQHLNTDTLSSLKNLLHAVRKSGMSELLLKDAFSQIYLNPHIWVYANYEVQRELYMFLIQHFENDTSQLAAMCGFPQIIDIVCQFYWDKADYPLAFGLKPLLHSTTKRIIGERPCREEIHKIRLLLLSLAEMSMKQKIDESNIKALIAFFEKSQDMACIEDVLQVVMRLLSQKPFLYSFLDQVNLLGGFQVFINLLQRDFEQVRLLSLQFMAKLLIGQPSDKKVQKFFNLSVGRIKSLPESHKKSRNNQLQTLFHAVSDRLFKFPLSDDLCATLFDVLLGGASPKQVLQNHALSEKTHSNRSSQFILPQTLILIFKFLESCQESSTRERILKDLLNLFDSNPSNIEALMENSWFPWLVTSVRLHVIRNYEVEAEGQAAYSTMNECYLVRNVYCIVLSHCIYSVKGGWQYLDETVNFLILHSEEGKKLSHNFLRDIFKDLVGSLLQICPTENCFASQPCRDNTYYLLKLIDDMLISEIGDKYMFPYCVLGSTFSHEDNEPESQKDIAKSVFDVLNDEDVDSNQLPRTAWNCNPVIEEDSITEDWWNFHDSLWALICEMNGKGPSKMFSKASIAAGPSLGQRARDLVESLNIPAAEMAAAVVSGGISGALSGKTIKYVDKAMLLRGERCLRFVFRLVMLYVCAASLERVSKCAQQFVSLLPYLLSFEDEQYKNRLQLYIWSLLQVRSQHRMRDDDARFRVILHIVLEMVNHGKAMLAVGDGSYDLSSILMDAGSINNNMFQKERVVHAVIDERKYIECLRSDRLRQIQEICVKMNEDSVANFNQKNAIEEEILASVNTIISSDDSRRASNQFSYDEEQQITAEKWIHMFRTLVDERGPWSSNTFPNNNLIRWKHDKTEDIWRRRPKLKRNYHFDEKLCHPPTATSTKDTSNSLSESQISTKSFPEKMKHFLLKGVRGIADEGSAEPCEDYENNNSLSSMASDPDLSSRGQHCGLAYDYKDQTDVAQDRRSSSSYSTDAEPSEVLLSIPTVLVAPKRKVAGHLSVMQSIVHFSSEFLVEGTGGSSVFQGIHILSNSDSGECDQLGRSRRQKLHRVPLRSELNFEKGDGKKNMNHDGALLNNCKKVKRHRRWKVAKIKAVHWTRYLLQYTAIEIFFQDSIVPIFLNFASPKDAKNVGTLIVNARNEALFPKGSSRDKAGIISFVDRRVATEMAETARERWRRREISNFEYLMILNTLAGRSYNDLTQYPVFPWVLADYTSEKLDLNKSSSFRDLSKPVGALDLKRFEVFEDRYRNFCDPDIPSFYYGSHYSSMGIVLFYLLRLEPCTALHRNLQGGKFDHADRLFQSIEGTWRNCLSNTSDVKELIPEFFYMPEFLVNMNSYHLGVKQDGEPLVDVSLPPWAKGSPEEFIYRHREALESEYVSSNLHHWIDLIFGYKQRGKPAVEATNVFYYLTYEGAIDLDSMDDDLQRSAIEDQIANFGQTPIQIFRKKHPRRGPPNPIAHPLYYAPASITLTSVVSNTVHSHSSVLCIGLVDSNIVIVYEGLYLTVKIWLTTQLQSGGNLTFSSSQDPFFGIGSDILYPHKIGTPLADNIELNAQCFAVLQTASENYIISCGCWDNSFQLISLNDGKIMQGIRQHKDVVSCIAVTSDGSVLATGSYDTTVMVWDVYRVRTTEKRFRSTQTEFSSKDRVIAESPSHILCGHDDIVTCLFVSTELDIIISGSKDGTCIFHTLRDGRYIRSIQHPSGSPLSKLAGSRDGRVVLYSENDLSLHMYSINGKHIASCESNGRLNCIELSNCGEFIICAGDHGQIILRSMHSLAVLRQYEGIGKAITALVVTPEDCFLAGTKDGSLLVYSVENPQLRRSSIPRNMKAKYSSTG